MLRFRDHSVGTLFRGKKTGLIYRLVMTLQYNFYLLLESEHKIYSINTQEDVSDYYEIVRSKPNLNKRCIDAINGEYNECVCV